MTKGTPSKMAMMSPKQRAEFKLKSMKKMGLKPGDLQKKPSGRPKLTKSQMLLQAQGKDLKGGPITSSTKKRSLAGGPKPKKFNVGGQAAESLRKGTLFKEKRDKRRKSVDDMIQRLYGPNIKPKPKPKKPLKKVLGDKIKPRLKKKPLKKRLKGG